MKKVKIFISENDAEDIVSNIIKGREGLYATWNYKIEGTDEPIDIEIHLGDEED